MKKLLFLTVLSIILACSTQAEFVSFVVSDESPTPIVYVAASDNMTVERKEDGLFKFDFPSAGSDQFQVIVSNDLDNIVWCIQDRGDGTFCLRIKKLAYVSGVLELTTYNPVQLCTVTVERIPAE